jgi:hypothetical protein
MPGYPQREFPPLAPALLLKSPHCLMQSMMVLGFLLACCASAAELRIRVTDETGRPIWTRLEVRGPSGKMYQAPGAILDQTATRRPGEPWYLGSFVVNGACTVEVPAARYSVIAEHGLEYERGEKDVDVFTETPSTVAFQLRPWIRMRERGWWSGDMHVHRPVEDAPSLSLAEDLNVSIVITMWNKRDLWAGKSWPKPVIDASPNHLVTVLNAEDERGGGAWLLQGLERRLDLAVDTRWYPPGIIFVYEARAQKPPGGILPWFDCEKPFWWEVPIMMALATPDSFGVLHNHFNQYGTDATEASGRTRDRVRYPGPEGFVNHSLGLYYRYLNLGFRMPPSAGSASGVLPNPVGYNRMYVKVPGTFSLDTWYKAVQQGEVFVTNGPALFFTHRRAGNRIEASIEVLAREPIARVELVANGSVIHSFPVKSDSKQFKGKFSFDAGGYSWMAARAYLKSGPAIRLAHSGPVYLPGKWDSHGDAQYFVEWIDDLIAETKQDAKRFASAAERDEILNLYSKARAGYEGKLR